MIYHDREFSYDEMSLAIMGIGRGIGLDGLDKNNAFPVTKGIKGCST